MNCHRVRLLSQLQAQHPVAPGNPDSAGRLRIMELVVTCPTRSHDELGQPFRVRLALGIHGRESFVVVVVAAEHQVGIGLGKNPPQWIEVEVVTVVPRAEARPVPVGKHALSWVRAQVLPKPCGLRIRIGASPNVVALGVQRDQMPGTEVVAVIALVRLTSAFAEVGVIASRAGRPVLMVSRHGKGDVAVGTPALVRTLSESPPRRHSDTGCRRGRAPRLAG